MFYSAGTLQIEKVSKFLSVWEDQVLETSPSGLMGRHFADSFQDRKVAFKAVWKEIKHADLETKELRTLATIIFENEEFSTSVTAACRMFSRSLQSINCELDEVSSRTDPFRLVLLFKSYR